MPRSRSARWVNNAPMFDAETAEFMVYENMANGHVSRYGHGDRRCW